MKKCYIVFVGLMGLIACKKEGNLNKVIPYLGGETLVKNPVDIWLETSFRIPYNIAVEYKWNQSEVDMNKYLVPPKEERIIPYSETVMKLWIDPYDQETGSSTFMKTYAPKQLRLVGSVALNPDGSGVLGIAEGGLKIILYGVNDFDKKDAGQIASIAHLIHHEFAHILNQNKNYPKDWVTVTPQDYSAQWQLQPPADAPRLGFITPYSRQNYGEDFAEMVSNMMIMGKLGFDNFVTGITDANGAPLPEATAKLRKKEALVVEYFKSAFNIDFYGLQKKVYSAIQDAGKD